MAENEVADLPQTEEQPAEIKGLDAHLSKALEGLDAPETAADETEKSKPKVDATGRHHGERGKFVAKESKTAEKPSDQGPAEGSQKPAEAKAPDQAIEPVEAPRNFTAEQKAAFSKLPRDLQESVIASAKDHEANFTRKSQEFADFRRAADPLLQAVEPFKDYLSQLQPVTGRTPAQAVNDLLMAEYRLRTGDTATKYQALAAIAQTYGVNLAALSRGEIVQPDPLITQLRQQVTDLTSRLGSFEQQSVQDQQRSLSLHIDGFANAKDESGRPRYPLFEQVRVSMGRLMADGKASTLEEAYSEAVKPIQAHIAAELESRQKATEESQKTALEKARKALPVKTSGTQPGTVNAKGLDAHLSNALASAGIN